MHSSFFILHFPYQPPKHGHGNKETEDIADRNGEPHAVETKVWGQQDKARDEEEHLAREALENALTSMADALEEVADDHLRSDDGEHHHIDAEPSVCHRYDGGIVGKEVRERVGEELAHDEACDHHHLGAGYSQPKGVPHTRVLPRAPVLAHDGMHALV